MDPEKRPTDLSIVPPERKYITKKALGNVSNPYKLEAYGATDNTDDSQNGKPKPLPAGKAIDQNQQ